jgi:Uncharacterized conserved protein
MQNVWLIRAMPDGHDRFTEFGVQNIIAIGWPNTGDLTGKTKADIRLILQKVYPFDSARKLAFALGRIDTFVHEIKADDIVVVPKRGEDDVMMGIVQSGYIYNAEKATAGYCHQKKVIWQIKTTRYNLPLEAQKFLYKRPATCRMKNYSESVRVMLNANHINVANPFEVPENDVFILGTMPTKINNDSLIDMALSIIKEEFKHADSNQRLKIAFDILNMKLK